MTYSLNYTKILLSASMIAFVAALVFGGTQAFFSDEEVSNGNTFAAGAIDLQIDNSSYGFDWNDPTVDNPSGVWGPNEANSWTLADLTDQLFFSFIDLKPGDYGEDTISLHVVDNDAFACMAFDLTGTPENGQNEPEAAVDETAGENEGELQNYLSFLFWMDDGDNVYEVGEDVIEDLSGEPGSVFTGEWLALAEGGDTPLTGDTTQYIGKGWCFGEMTEAPVAQDGVGTNPPSAPERIGFTCNGAGDHNDAQTDGIVVDVGFYAVQSRNNDQFSCAALPAFDGGETDPDPVRESVGAVLGAYSAPETCDLTVGDVAGDADHETIQEAVDAATTGQTICVEDGTYNETVTISQPLTLAAENGPLNSATIEGGVRVESDDVTVTGFIVNPGSFLGTNAAFYLNGSLSNIEISYNDIDGLDENPSVGVETTTGAAYSNVVIDNNIIHDLNVGIYTNPHTGLLTIENNDIDDNTAGIGGLNGATVRYNDFGHTTPGSEAIGIDATFDGNIATINFNNFLNDVMLNDYGAIAVVNAEDNFFSNGGVNQTTTPADFDFDPEEVAAFPHN